MNATNPNDREFDDGDEGQDLVLDGLLREILNNSDPPDLSSKILRRLSQETENVQPPPVVRRDRVSEVESDGSDAPQDSRSVVQPSSGPDASGSKTTLAVVMTLAASLLVALAWYGWDTRPTGDAPSVAEKPPGTDKDTVAADNESGQGDKSKQDAAPEPHDQFAATSDRPTDSALAEASPDNLPSVKTLHDGSDGSGATTRNNPGNTAVAVQRIERWLESQRPPALNVAVVDDLLDDQFERYWTSLGVTPTPPRSDQQWAQFVRDRLNVDLDPSLHDDADRIRKVLRGPDQSKTVARQLLDDWTDGGLQSVGTQKRQSLIQSLAEVIRDGDNAAVWLADLMGGQHPDSAAFAKAMSRGGPHAMVGRFASLSMGRDVRCLRCHDALVDTGAAQQEYWAFASLIRNRLSSDAGSPVFFDATDGRRVMTRPGAAIRWVVGDTWPAPTASRGGNGDREVLDLEGRIEQRTRWAQSLTRSPAVADGLVNAIWESVYQRPLQGSLVDVDSAPMDATLGQIEQTLVADLWANQFDLARTIALVVASPPADRTTATSLSTDQPWTIDPADDQAYAAFAASRAAVSRISMRKRGELVMATGGGLLRIENDQVVLAQGLHAGAANDDGVSARERLRQLQMRDFPVREDTYPVAWLASVADADSRLDHLCFLAGWDDVPPLVSEADRSMRDGQIPEKLRLHRLWWMIQP
ncbi:hypothetical protein [Crateriforma conspicua]|uniref:DUF1549 domain-containing protein n=1 Tax=Crateriforma conspicua TaxID=2527996 RepID=A0A5C5YB97_9PLAN|nr:hypothetical protein [Crateriforma conspicua]TWT71681.1 hypothetical protein Pan14r_39920 [Crateriforma conspicua]